MELLREGILHLEKQLKGINFDLAVAKAIKMILYSMTTIVTIAICILVGLVVTSALRFAFADVVVLVIVFGVYIWWIWFMSPLIIEECNKEIIDLEKEKIECKRDIEKYKNDMIDLREMEKKVMKSKLTEKQGFKWLIVTEDGEVVVSDMKPDYDEEFDVWFFSCEAKTAQVGSNKKLAKHSKHTLTRIV